MQCVRRRAKGFVAGVRKLCWSASCVVCVWGGGTHRRYWSRVGFADPFFLGQGISGPSESSPVPCCFGAKGTVRFQPCDGLLIRAAFRPWPDEALINDHLGGTTIEGAWVSGAGGRSNEPSGTKRRKTTRNVQVLQGSSHPLAGIMPSCLLMRLISQ
jgi:hypothetical protein